MSSSPTTNTEVPGYVGKFNGESIIIPNISEILKTDFITWVTIQLWI